ncbi:MAG: hypothetical protein HQK55_16430 [Deltaproteobacteria bacterium]|nr:hypothetical protein [Deltaproteobacteria bacterium]
MKIKQIMNAGVILLIILESDLMTYARENSDDFSKGFLNREEVIKSAATVDLSTFPSTDVVIADMHRWVKYNQDGTYLVWLDIYYKPLTEAGRVRCKTLSANFQSNLNTQEFTFLEVIKPDGSSRTIDIKSNSRVMVGRSQAAPNN